MEKPNLDVGYTCGYGANADGYGKVCIDLDVVEVEVADGCACLVFHKDLAPDVVGCIQSVFDLD